MSFLQLRTMRPASKQLLVLLGAVALASFIQVVHGQTVTEKPRLTTRPTKPAYLCAVDLHVELTSKFRPLFVRIPTARSKFTNDIYDFVLPTDNKGLISLKIGEKVQLACPGEGNSFADTEGHQPERVREVTCRHEGENKLYFETARGNRKTIEELSCTTQVVANAVKISGTTCGANKSLYRIQYDIDTNGPRRHTISIIEICFNHQTQSTFYAKADLTPGISVGQKKLPDKVFRFDERVYSYSPTEYYRIDTSAVRPSQVNTFRTLLSRTDVINENADRFLTKGHLIARTDFVYGIHQHATYFYLNTAPQWSSFNEGNWNMVETALQRYAGSHQKKLVVYTGTYGILSMNNVNQQKTPLYLFNGRVQNTPKKLTEVPLYFWKAIIDKTSSGRGVVIVGVNDPFQGHPNICKTDVCNQIAWLKSEINAAQRQNVAKGQIYCCSVDAFGHVVKAFPVKAANLLT